MADSHPSKWTLTCVFIGNTCMYIRTLFFFPALLKQHLSTLTEIMVAAWSIDLGVLLLLFFLIVLGISNCF